MTGGSVKDDREKEGDVNVGVEADNRVCEEKEQERVAAVVAHVVDGGGLKPELVLELLAFMGGGRAARS